MRESGVIERKPFLKKGSRKEPSALNKLTKAPTETPTKVKEDSFLFTKTPKEIRAANSFKSLSTPLKMNSNRNESFDIRNQYNYNIMDNPNEPSSINSLHMSNFQLSSEDTHIKRHQENHQHLLNEFEYLEQQVLDMHQTNTNTHTHTQNHSSKIVHNNSNNIGNRYDTTTLSDDENNCPSNTIDFNATLKFGDMQQLLPPSHTSSSSSSSSSSAPTKGGSKYSNNSNNSKDDSKISFISRALQVANNTNMDNNSTNIAASNTYPGKNKTTNISACNNTYHESSNIEPVTKSTTTTINNNSNSNNSQSHITNTHHNQYDVPESDLKINSPLMSNYTKWTDDWLNFDTSPSQESTPIPIQASFNTMKIQTQQMKKDTIHFNNINDISLNDTVSFTKPMHGTHVSAGIFDDESNEIIHTIPTNTQHPILLSSSSSMIPQTDIDLQSSTVHTHPRSSSSSSSSSSTYSNQYQHNVEQQLHHHHHQQSHMKSTVSSTDNDMISPTCSTTTTTTTNQNNNTNKNSINENARQNHISNRYTSPTITTRLNHQNQRQQDMENDDVLGTEYDDDDDINTDNNTNNNNTNNNKRSQSNIHKAMSQLGTNTSGHHQLHSEKEEGEEDNTNTTTEDNVKYTRPNLHQILHPSIRKQQRTVTPSKRMYTTGTVTSPANVGGGSSHQVAALLVHPHYHGNTSNTNSSSSSSSSSVNTGKRRSISRSKTRGCHTTTSDSNIGNDTLQNNNIRITNEQKFNDKLIELEKEIDIYKHENTHLKSLKKQQDLLLLEIQKEKVTCTKWISEEKEKTEKYCADIKVQAERERRQIAKIALETRQRIMLEGQGYGSIKKEKNEIEQLRVTIDKLQTDIELQSKKMKQTEKRYQQMITESTHKLNCMETKVHEYEHEKVTLYQYLDEIGLNLPLNIEKLRPKSLIEKQNNIKSMKGKKYQSYAETVHVDSVPVRSAVIVPEKRLIINHTNGSISNTNSANNNYSNSSSSSSSSSSSTGKSNAHTTDNSDRVSIFREGHTGSSITNNSVLNIDGYDRYTPPYHPIYTPETLPPSYNNNNDDDNDDDNMYDNSEENEDYENSTPYSTYNISKSTTTTTPIRYENDTHVTPEIQLSSISSTINRSEQRLSDGRRILNYRNGTMKEIYPDGRIHVHFTNGDMKWTNPLTEEIIYYYHDADTKHITCKNGCEIYVFPNQQMEKHYPDGKKEIFFPDKTHKTIYTDGTQEIQMIDGSIIREYNNGHINPNDSIKDTNINMEIHDFSIHNNNNNNNNNNSGNSHTKALNVYETEKEKGYVDVRNMYEDLYHQILQSNTTQMIDPIS